MVNTLVRKSNNGSLLFEPEIVERIHHPFFPRCSTMASLSMTVEPSNFPSMARSKLHSSVGGKSGCSLHRWVLLKNSMLRALTTPSLNQSEPTLSNHACEGESEDEEVITDSFMFPDAENLVESGDASEAQWLDSLLETLGDDEDSDNDVNSLPPEEDDDQPLSPLLSPMSSSDDLTSSAYDVAHIPSPYTYPYPVPYPPFHPPPVHPCDDSFEDSFFNSSYDNPFPYCDEDDVADLPVPDSIEDTSDDESDTPLTPSLGHSNSSLDFIEPAVSPPDDRISLGRTIPGIFINTPDSCFYPHPDDFHLPFVYQEC
ncbi:hypothetical protein L218DRAFT_979430 [Marasmius fiardii PR-910]|nr:hypothetical protein L218DRAFT_979430 [Marasmius fiardii PR-910]